MDSRLERFTTLISIKSLAASPSDRHYLRNHPLVQPTASRKRRNPVGATPAAASPSNPPPPQFDGAGRPTLTPDSLVTLLKFNEKIAPSRFVPVYQPGVFVLDEINKKEYIFAAPPDAPQARLDVPPRAPSFSPALPTAGLLLGLLLIAFAGFFSTPRRRDPDPTDRRR